MSRRIPLTQGKFAIIDAADFDLVSQYKWRLHKGGQTNPEGRTSYYARGRKIGDSYTEIYMHRLIMEATKEQEIDHKNHNGLDNRRSNLRLATASQNKFNRRMEFDHKHSKFKGVTWCKKIRRWKARIYVRGKVFNLGTFANPTEAAIAYNNAAKKHHGDFAYLNDI